MKNKHLFLLILVTGFVASCTQFYSLKGDKAYDRLAYQNSIRYYEKYLSRKTSNRVKIKLANAYRLTNNFSKAETVFEEIVYLPESNPINMLYYGKVLMNEKKYEEAKVWLSNYLKVRKNDFVAQILLSSCNSINKFMHDSMAYTIKKANIPEVASAFGQVKYGTGIVFSADKEVANSLMENGWTGRSYLDLYFSEKDENGKWISPKKLEGDINGDFHEGPATFNKEQNVVYFTRSNYSKKHKLIKSSTDESNLKIFRAELTNDKWSNMLMLPFNSDEYSCGHPALAADGKTLYFISDMPDGFGGTDIYKISIDSSEFSKPQNLGIEVNSPGNEMFPFIHNDGTLYFSSDARDNLGGLDVFETTCNKTTCLTSENMDYPINTTKDDFAFTLSDDKKVGYISSNRDSLDHIYEVIKNEPEFFLKGEVSLVGTHQVLAGALVEIVNLETKKKDRVHSSNEGRYQFKLDKNSNYLISSVKEGYSNISSELSVSTQGKIKSETFTADFLFDTAPQLILSGKVFLKENNELLEGAIIEIEDIQTKTKKIAVSRLDGHYKIILDVNKKYKVKSYMEGYLTVSPSVKVTTPQAIKQENFTADFILDKMEVEKSFELGNIYYDLGKWTLKQSATKELDLFVGFMNNNPKINIEIGSYTDSRAADQYNLILSEKRAKAVVDYLVSKGIDAKRLTLKGYGETKLVNRCGNLVKCTEEEHEKNRRTEFKIVKINK